MPKLGRPKGTLRRDEAIAAANAIARGEYSDIRSAAKAFKPTRIGSDEGFRDFIRHVEEAYRDLIDTQTIGSLRKKYGPLTSRSRNRSRQPSEKKMQIAKLKAELAAISDFDNSMN